MTTPTTVKEGLDALDLIFLARGQQRSSLHDEVVKIVQRALQKNGNYHYLIDGDFGGRTDSAVREFQHQHGLVADGRVGIKTARDLDDVLRGEKLPLVIPSTPYAAGYLANWEKMVIRPSVIPAIDNVIREMLDDYHWREYLEVEAATRVPAQVTAIINDRESGGHLDTYLGNGQKLNRVTTIVPKGRGPFHGPDAFVKGAIDAYKLEKMLGLSWYDGSGIPRLGYKVEGFNGFGYRNRGLNSPYLYAGSQLYSRGKYVADGKFDPNYVDTQLGALVIFKRLVQLHPEFALEKHNDS